MRELWLASLHSFGRFGLSVAGFGGNAFETGDSTGV